MRAMGRLLAASLLLTEGILVLEGRAREALPLHLCGVSALVALALAFGAGAWALDWLWYLGMPGALLALLFPAPAVSRYQALMNVSYVTTHALIIAIPAACMKSGRRVRRGRGLWAWARLHLLALAAFAANTLLGTDYLFLSAPPWGTPLSAAFAWGYGAYLLALEAIACALLAASGRAAPRFAPKLFA